MKHIEGYLMKHIAWITLPLILGSGALIVLTRRADSQVGAKALVALQSSTPGTGQAGHINVTGTGIFGHMGLGTQSPGSRLDVTDSTSSAGQTGKMTNTGSGYGLYASTAGDFHVAALHGVATGIDGNGVIGRADNGSGAWGVGGVSINGVGVGGQTTNGVAVAGYGGNGFAGQFYGKSYFSDKVGIGTLSPSRPLDVAANTPGGTAAMISNSGSGWGLQALSTGGSGVGMYGQNGSVGGYAPYAGTGGISSAPNGVGVFGMHGGSGNTYVPGSGVSGSSGVNGLGVYGYSGSTGMWASSPSGTALLASTTSGYAAFFHGRTMIRSAGGGPNIVGLGDASLPGTINGPGSGGHGIVRQYDTGGNIMGFLEGIIDGGFTNRAAVGVADHTRWGAGMYINSGGAGVVFADVKTFRTANPDAEGTDIVYACVEGPEAAAYVRGTARLVNGSAVVALPHHFVAVATLSGMTVQLTPNSADSKGLAVVSKSLDGGIAVRELMGGKGSYEFDYLITAVRKGYEDYQVIQPALETSNSVTAGGVASWRERKAYTVPSPQPTPTVESAKPLGR